MSFSAFLRLWPRLVIVAGSLLLLVLFPPFKVVSRAPAGASLATSFSAEAFVADFWSTRLLPATRSASPWGPLLRALQVDPVAARSAHGHKVGEGSTWYYFGQGSGVVTSVEKNRLVLTVDDAHGASLALRTGPVFGNSIRDGCGLLNLNDVPGLAEFNAVSTALNHRVESEVQPRLRSGIGVGTRLKFSGCAEAPESVRAGPLLTLIPLTVEVGH